MVDPDVLTDRLLARRAERRGAAALDAPGDGPVPLSYAQERMWLLEQMAAGGPAGNNYLFVFHLDGPLDEAALRRAIHELHRRQEVLRTAYRLGADGPQQVVLEPGQPLPPATDLTSEADPQRAAAEQALAMGATPYDLDVAAPVRWQLFRLAPRRHLLAFGVHHIAFDGWSESVLHAELATLYVPGRHAAADAGTGLRRRFADYARQQRRQFDDDSAPALQYWCRRLQGAPVALSLPFDRPPRPGGAANSATRVAELPVELVGRLEAFGRETRASLYMLLLAGFGALLGERAGQDDLVVGTPHAGRHEVELEQLIGSFVNMVPMRLHLAGRPSFRQLVHQVRDTALEAFSYADAPLERIIAAAAPLREPGRPPLTQAFFQVHNTPRTPLALHGLEVRIEQPLYGGTSLDLGLVILAQDGTLRAFWKYRTDRFDAASIDRLHQDLGRLLLRCTDGPDRPAAGDWRELST